MADLSLVGFHESDLFWHVIGPSFVFLAHSRSLYFEQQQKITNIKTILIILFISFLYHYNAFFDAVNFMILKSCYLVKVKTAVEVGDEKLIVSRGCIWAEIKDRKTK